MSPAYRAGFLDRCAELGVDGHALVKEAGPIKGTINFIGRLAGSKGTLGRLEKMLARARTSRPAVVPKIESWIAQENAAVRKARDQALTAGLVSVPLFGIPAIVNSRPDKNEQRWHSYSYETDDRW